MFKYWVQFFLLLFCLAFRKAWCFCLDSQHTVLLHHDWLYLEEVILEGTCLPIDERLFVLQEVHSKLMGVSTENSEMKVFEKWWGSSSIPEIFAFFHRYTHLFGSFCLSGRMLESVRSMLLSLKPGIDIHLLTSVGLLVMKMSSVFSALERLPLVPHRCHVPHWQKLCWLVYSSCFQWWMSFYNLYRVGWHHLLSI